MELRLGWMMRLGLRLRLGLGLPGLRLRAEAEG